MPDVTFWRQAGRTFAASTDMIPRFILPAIREQGDDSKAAVKEREYVSPYGKSRDGSRIVRP